MKMDNQITAKNFALIGAAGFVAPRHLAAIRDTGNRLVAAADPHDSVGILDSFFPGARYFPEIERFDRHLEKLRRGPEEQRVHWVSICSPNYLHDAHARLALRVGADVICEKPLVISPWNLDQLAALEAESGRRVFTVLQLRLHPAVEALRRTLTPGPSPAGGRGEQNRMRSIEALTPGPVDAGILPNLPSPTGGLPAEASAKAGGPGRGYPAGGRGEQNRMRSIEALTPATPHQVDLTYVTGRGNWYTQSWKGDDERSGSVAMNIGVHFFDLLLWLFGPVRGAEVFERGPTRMSGSLELERAEVNWLLSVDFADLPPGSESSTHRVLRVDGEEVDLSGGFGDLHTRVYAEALAGRGFSIEDARPSIELVHRLRHAELTPGPG